MLVQCHERFDVVAEFDPQSGRLLPEARPAGLPVGATDGWFSILNGSCVVFYRQSGHLWLLVGDRTFDLDGDASVDWRREGSVAVFAVADRSGQVVLRYGAGPASGPPLDEDATPFVEEEDWDLGLFVANVMFNEERSELLRHGPA